MRLRTLAANTRRSSIDLGTAEGLVAFVAADEADWREYVAVLRMAFASLGGFRAPGPAVSGPDGPVRVGTPDFEALLAPLLAAYRIGREEYAALWFGAGAAAVWLSSAGSLAGRQQRLRNRQGVTGKSSHGVVVGRAGPEARVRELRDRAAAARAQAEAGMLAWVREQQDAETRLLLYRDRERELRQRLGRIEKAGEDATCAGCGRSLGERADAVCKARREEWEAVVQDGKWWRQRRDQLADKPRRVEQEENRAAALEAEAAALSDEVVREAEPEGTEVAAAARRRVRRAIHRKAVSLTGGRFAGAFPGLYADWVEGAREGTGREEIVSLELAARITMVRFALERGMEVGSVVFPVGLEQLSGEDLPRVLAELADLAKHVPLLVVKVTPHVAAAAPECFDLLLRFEDSPAGRCIRRQRPSLGLIRLR